MLFAVFAALPHSRLQADAPSPAVPLGPNRGWIEAVALSPDFAHDGNAWCAAYGGKIFASTDGGRTWHSSWSGETDPVVTGLAVSPAFTTDRLVFAAADDGVFRSHDGGTSWENTSSGLQGHFARALAVSPGFARDRTLYAATDAGVYRSVNGGDFWQPPGNDSLLVTSVATAGTAGESIIFSGPASGGLLESTNGGVSWSGVSSFPSSRQALSIAPSMTYAADGTIMVGTDSGVWETRDHGATWSPGGLASDRIDAMALSPGFFQDKLAFAGSASGNGVYRSTDAGDSWQSPPAVFAGHVQSLAVSRTFNIDHALFAGAPGTGLTLSSDAGMSWLPANSGLHAAQVVAVRSDLAAVVMAGNGAASMLNPGSSSWTDLALPTPFVTALDSAGAELYAGTQDQGLLHSSDGGMTWRATSLPPSPVSAVGMPPVYAQDGTVLAAAGSVFVSTDSGVTWSAASGLTGNDVRSFSFSAQFRADRTVFASTLFHGLFRSSDGGSTWISSSSGLPHDQIGNVLVPVASGSTATWYVPTGGDGVYASTDGGMTWARIAVQPPVRVVLALDRDAQGQIIAATERGVYELVDNRWVQLGAGWVDYATCLAVSYVASSSTLYVGTLGDGVWKIDLSSAANTATSTVATASPAATKPAPFGVPSPTATPRRLHPHLGVLPVPLIFGQPSLVKVHGPPLGTVRLSLRAGLWRRDFAAGLPADGRVAFGFVAPESSVSVTAKVTGHGLSGSAQITVPVGASP